MFVGVGVTLLDFSADSCDGPLRAFILDVCNLKDQATALNIHAFLGGMGASVGYILASIEWENTILNRCGDELQILFTIITFLFVFSLVCTMTSVKEKRYLSRNAAKLKLNQVGDFKTINLNSVHLPEENGLKDLFNSFKEVCCILTG